MGCKLISGTICNCVLASQCKAKCDCRVLQKACDCRTEREEACNKCQVVGYTGALQMKPFNLEEAKAGKPVVTVNGNKVRDLIYSSGFIAGVVEYKTIPIHRMGVWNNRGESIQIGASPREAALQMYEEPPKEFWACVGDNSAFPDYDVLKGWIYANKEHAERTVRGFSNATLIKLVEVKE